jgi:hypothetical protein
VKVRIKSVPQEREMDGVRLDHFQRDSIVEVSASIGSWLIAEGYADPEMRHDPRNDYEQEFSGIKPSRDRAHDHPHRRRTDR